jgi:hypothetical protein
MDLNARRRADLPRSYHALKEARGVVFEETRALR